MSVSVSLSLSSFKLSPWNSNKCYHFNIEKKFSEFVIYIYLNGILWKMDENTVTFTSTIIKISRSGED